MADDIELNTTDLLVEAAWAALEDLGFTVQRKRSRSRIWEITGELNGEAILGAASVRTTQDRWFAFPPLPNGWKTLEDVDHVIVSAVNYTDHPSQAEVYVFPAKGVRHRFDKAYEAREKAGQVVAEGFGMWVARDRGSSTGVVDVGNGLAEDYAELDQRALRTKRSDDAPAALAAIDGGWSRTIVNVRERAQTEIAEIAGVPKEKVKIDVRIEG